MPAGHASMVHGNSEKENTIVMALEDNVSDEMLFSVICQGLREKRKTRDRQFGDITENGRLHIYT